MWNEIYYTYRRSAYYNTHNATAAAEKNRDKKKNLKS